MDKSRALSENDLQFVMPQLQNFQEKGLFGEFLKKDSITITNVLLKFDKEWKLSTNCSICSQVFDKRKMLFEHHCRFNGEAVCGSCSRHLLNKERVCDVCFLKLISQDHVKVLDHNLMDMDNTIESYKKMIEPIEKGIESLEIEKTEEKNIYLEKEEKLNKNLSNLSREIAEFEQKDNIRISEKLMLKDKLHEMEAYIASKMRELETIKNSKSMIEIENTIKKQDLKQKGKKFLELKKKLEAKEQELIDINKMDDIYDENEKKLLIRYQENSFIQEKNREKCHIF